MLTLNHKLEGRIVVAVKVGCSARKDCAVFPLGRMDAQLRREAFLILKLPSTVSALWRRKLVIFMKTLQGKIKLQQQYNISLQLIFSYQFSFLRMSKSDLYGGGGEFKKSTNYKPNSKTGDSSLNFLNAYIKCEYF